MYADYFLHTRTCFGLVLMVVYNDDENVPMFLCTCMLSLLDFINVTDPILTHS